MSPASPDTLNATAQGRLRTIVERIERLDEEKAEIGGHIKEVFAEAKGEGFDVKILRRVIAYRKQDRAKRQEEEAILDLYLSALGELPLFEPRTAEPPPADSGEGRDPGRAPDADIKVTISGPGGLHVETTTGAMKRAAAQLKRSRSGRLGAGSHRPARVGRPQADDAGQTREPA